MELNNVTSITCIVGKKDLYFGCVIIGYSLGLESSDTAPLGVRITKENIWALEGHKVCLKSIRWVADSTRS